MLASRWTARRAGPALAGVLLAAGTFAITTGTAGAQPAKATTTTEEAISSWQIGGADAFNISLQATQVTAPGVSTLFFKVTEQFCDVARNREVFRTFTAQTPSTGDVLSFAPYVDSAVLAAPNLIVTGSQQSLANCASPSGTPSTKSLGKSKATVLVVWQATAPLSESQPGIKVRPAESTGVETSDGPLDLGPLGQAQFAQLRIEKS